MINTGLYRMKFTFLAILVFTASSCVAADDSFITKFEYGKMLYKNPRGIGCNSCHGQKGEGGLIARYGAKGKSKELSAPRITDVPFENFKKSLNSEHLVMPRYYLTDGELDALYYYLQELK